MQQRNCTPFALALLALAMTARQTHAQPTGPGFALNYNGTSAVWKCKTIYRLRAKSLISSEIVCNLAAWFR